MMTDFHYKGSYDYIPDYTYIPYIEDFCRGCKYARTISLYGDEGSLFSPEPYSYRGYICTYYDDKILYIGSGKGEPFGCPILDDRKKYLIPLIEKDIERDKQRRLSEECYHISDGYCKKYNHECNYSVMTRSLCKGFLRGDYHEP